MPDAVWHDPVSWRTRSRKAKKEETKTSSTAGPTVRCDTQGMPPQSSSSSVGLACVSTDSMSEESTELSSTPTLSPVASPASSEGSTEAPTVEMDEEDITCFLTDEALAHSGEEYILPDLVPFADEEYFLLKRCHDPTMITSVASRFDAVLRSSGYACPEQASQCAKAAIAKGFIALDKGLDQVLAEWTCPSCNRAISATLRDCLRQADRGSSEERNLGGALQCPDCHIGRYISKMCDGSFEVTEGRFHHHCTLCSNMGKCVGDIHEEHCLECNGHFFAGLGSNPCHCAGRHPDMSEMICGMASGFDHQPSLWEIVGDGLPTDGFPLGI